MAGGVARMVFARADVPAPGDHLSPAGFHKEYMIISFSQLVPKHSAMGRVQQFWNRVLLQQPPNNAGNGSFAQLHKRTLLKMVIQVMDLLQLCKILQCVILIKIK